MPVQFLKQSSNVVTDALIPSKVLAGISVKAVQFSKQASRLVTSLMFWNKPSAIVVSPVQFWKVWKKDVTPVIPLNSVTISFITELVLNSNPAKAAPFHVPRILHS